MKAIVAPPQSSLDRGLRRLMAAAGILMVAAPAAEICVQLTFGERPQILLLGGFFIVGILTVTHALPQRSRWPFGAGRLRSPEIRGEALWLPDREHRRQPPW